MLIHKRGNKSIYFLKPFTKLHCIHIHIERVPKNKLLHHARYRYHDIDALVEDEKNNSTLLDCLWGEVYGSINSAEVDLLITSEQAAHLRKKYLYGENEDV